MAFCMVGMALRPSLRSELDSNANQQADNATTIGVVPLPTEDFSVDCFFDFSEGDCKDGLLQEQEAGELKSQEEEQEEKDSFSESISSQESQDRVDDDNNSNSSGFSDSLFAHELPVPADDLAHLEWLSQFADDSLSEVPVPYVASEERKPENLEKARLEPEPKEDLTDGSSHFPSGVPAKARTKRPRPAARTWSVGSPLTESSSSSSSTLSCPVPTGTISTIDSSNTSGGPPMKKPKNRPAVQTGEMSGSAQFQRRCSHCQVQKTPQWRAGPLGPKTLCNACGVRYKSGRLFPEYRPACSPTFSGDIHSNSHRKVLEIRKRKENAEAELDVNHAVPCF